MSTYFILQIYFIKVFLQLLFLLFKNTKNRENTSFILFLSLKITGILPKIYNGVFWLFFSKITLGYDQLFNCKINKSKITHIYLCDQALSLKMYTLPYGNKAKFSRLESPSQFTENLHPYFFPILASKLLLLFYQTFSKTLLK
jgi:hypothetical protein